MLTYSVEEVEVKKLAFSDIDSQMISDYISLRGVSVYERDGGEVRYGFRQCRRV